jgi:hypothetical protein
LSDEDNRAVPLIFQFRQRTGNTDKHRDMRVMSARMHHGNLFTFIVLGDEFAGVRQAGFLSNG